VALAGVIVIGDVTVTAAVAAVPPAIGVAFTAQLSATSGAVYNPALVTVPHVAAQVALALAVNCCVAPWLRVTVAGEMVIDVGALAPIPVREICCGLLVALSVIDRVAVRVPLPVGLKRRVSVQEEEPARLEPQVFL